MKTKLLLFTFLVSITLFAQVGNGFENVSGAAFTATGGACQYFDFNTTTEHTLVNYNAPCGLIYVSEPSSGVTLGYSITLDPTSPNGPAGFSDGDFFGVGTSAFFSNEIGFVPPEGSQAFFMEDPDGYITMTFDLVDLAGATNPQFSMQYILEGTSWEVPNDFLKITIKITDCGTSTVTVIDTSGLDIDNLGIEDTWNTLNADLSSFVGCKAQLVIEFSSNSAAEELGLDAILFTGGNTLSIPSFDLNNAISVFPNPSNGYITIKNSGVALGKVVIVDLNGRTVAAYDLNGITVDKELNLSSLLSSGMYFMTLTSKDKSITKKILISEN